MLHLPVNIYILFVRTVFRWSHGRLASFFKLLDKGQKHGYRHGYEICCKIDYCERLRENNKQNKQYEASTRETSHGQEGQRQEQQES